MTIETFILSIIKELLEQQYFLASKILDKRKTWKKHKKFENYKFELTKRNMLMELKSKYEEARLVLVNNLELVKISKT